MTTTPATQALLPVTPEDRRAAASIYQRFRDHDYAGWILAGTNAGGDADFVLQTFARHRQAHSLPGDVGQLAAMREALEAISVSGIHRDAKWFGMNAHDIARAALAPSALSGDAGEVWQPIETCPMWAVAVVTDGISVAISQRAEADDGTPYWAIDPEDGLDWEPTYWVPALDEQLPSHQGACE